MKNLILALSLLLTSSIGLAQDKSVKTMTLAVKGNCDECKKRIENSADIKGVKLCVWDENKQMATVTYKADKVTPQQIEQAIAAGGHDAGSTSAKSASYSKLPNCCKYRDKKCEEKKK